MERAVEKLLAAAERLIAELDALEPDPDLEDTHDAEATNEDGGDINDEGHDEGWDSGIGDKAGLEEQFGAFVGKGYTRTVPTVDEGDVEVTYGQHAEELRAVANNAARYDRTDRNAAEAMLDELQRRGLYIGLDGHCTFIEDGVVRVTGPRVY
jgi:hypothetical protein